LSDDAVVFGQVVHTALWEAKRLWCKDHAKGMDHESFAAENFTQCVLTVHVGKTQQTHLYVQIDGRKSWQSSVYIFRALRQLEGKYSPTLQHVT
jgi:hypothetical protein